MKLQQRVQNLLRKIEWSGRRGYNNSFVAACPACSGVKNGHGWSSEAVGHAPDCELNAILADLNAAPKKVVV